MSALAITTGLILIKEITTVLTQYFPLEDRAEFQKALDRLLSALEKFETTSKKSGTQRRIAHQAVEFHLSYLLDILGNETVNQTICDVMFCCLYRQITKTLDNFECLLKIHARKQHLLADLYEIPMDCIHGRLYEYKMAPDTHYTVPILQMLLTRTGFGCYPNETIQKAQENFRLSKENAVRRLDRLYGIFEETAARYQSNAPELILQLLDKKNRNATVHAGNELVKYYRQHQGPSMEPKFRDFLNDTNFRSMRELFDDSAIDHLEKIFTNYCKSNIEQWYQANEAVVVCKRIDGQISTAINGCFLGRRPLKNQGNQNSRRYYIVRPDNNRDDLEIDHKEINSISRRSAQN